MSERALPSRGHGAARWTIEVRVSPDSRSLYAELLPGTIFPEGTLIAAFHHDPARGRAGPIYVMEKARSGWQRSVVDPDGARRADAELHLCGRCHAEAVADQVFGLPSTVER